MDHAESVIASSRAIARELGYHNMEFIAADLRAYTPPAGVTAVISLHACDIATDLALITAVRAGARYIACVPCCHKELLDQYRIDALEPLLRQGVFRARMNDLLTDSMRALWLESRGYRVISGRVHFSAGHAKKPAYPRRAHGAGKSKSRAGISKSPPSAGNRVGIGPLEPDGKAGRCVDRLAFARPPHILLGKSVSSKLECGGKNDG